MITDQINADIKQAMLAKDKKKLDALRAIKSALMLLATDKGADGKVSDDGAIGAMQKLVKQRNDAASIYREQGRADMAEEEEFQAEVIKAYLPAMMSEDEVRQEVAATITQVGATGPADMGKVMGPVMGKLKGRADGKMISDLVKSELNNI